jgi:hypothetical protein
MVDRGLVRHGSFSIKEQRWRDRQRYPVGYRRRTQPPDRQAYPLDFSTGSRGPVKDVEETSIVEDAAPGRAVSTRVWTLIPDNR